MSSCDFNFFVVRAKRILDGGVGVIYYTSETFRALEGAPIYCLNATFEIKKSSGLGNFLRPEARAAKNFLASRSEKI